MVLTESNATKTLADVDGSSSLCPVPASSKTLDAASVEFCAGFGHVLDENGFKVSAISNSHCSNDDNAMLFAKQVVEIDEENGVENSALNGDCSDTKVVYNGNNTPLAVEVTGSVTSEKESNFLSSQNGEEFGGKSTEINGSILNPRAGENCNVTEERCNMEINTPGFVVGDFVWGKIRNLFNNFAWWPGRIYDPSDASEYAAKYKRDDRILLVAYFGDGSFSWCQPLQLKPFAENFEEMSKQSNSKSFVNAVQEALDEICWVVGSKMACSCVPQEHRDMVGTKIVNAGIKPGVLVPEGRIGKEFVELRHDPADLLARVRNIGQTACVDSLFEVTLLKSWLTEFHRAKGRNLQIYNEAKYVEGLEHDEESEVKAESDGFKPMEVWIQVPIEVYGKSSPLSSGNGDVKREKVNNGVPSRARKRKNVSYIENDDKVEEGKKETGKSFSQRKIKRSRYLSYPYLQLPEELDIVDDDTIEKVQEISSNSVKEHPNPKLFDDEESQRYYIRCKLEKMRSMLEGAGTSAQIKSELQGEVNDLLEMVKMFMDRV